MSFQNIAFCINEVKTLKLVVHTTIAYIDSIQYLALHVLPELFCGHWAHLLKKQRPYPAFITQLKAVIHKVNIIIMSLCDRNRVLSYTKALAFIICVGGFVWKLSDSYAAFISKDVGTKTNLKANYEENLPGLAVCRHPNQITTRWNGNISLEDKYNMTLTHLRVCDILLKSIQHLNFWLIKNHFHIFYQNW